MLLISSQHATSALWGLLAIALPSTLFAARLALGARTPAGGTILVLAGEFLKVGASIAIMFAASQIDPDLIWWSLLVASVVSLKSYFLAFFLR